MTKFLFFGSFLATTCAVVQGAVVNNLSEDLTGVVLNPGHPDAELSEPFIGWFAETKEILNACANDGVGTVCDVYLNIHTEFSVCSFFTRTVKCVPPSILCVRRCSCEINDFRVPYPYYFICFFLSFSFQLSISLIQVLSGATVHNL
jgi:hypothetical protein